jgi:hypothetical protein
MVRFARLIALVLLVLSIAMTAWSLASLFVPGAEALPDRPDLLDFLTFATIFLVFPVVGLAIAWKRPDNLIGWSFLVIGFLIAESVFATEYAGREAYTGVVLPGAFIVAWIGTIAWFIAGGAALPLAIATFPTGRHLSPRWRTAFLVALLAVMVVMVAAVLKPGEIDGFDGYFLNPIGLPGRAGELAAALYEMGTVVLVAPIVLGIASLIVRFRRAAGPERQQLKWLALPAMTVVVGIVAAAITQHDLAWSVMLLGLAGVPIAAGIAILRYRLFDIDVVIRRTLVYALVVAVLGAVYVGLVLAMQAGLSGVTGGGPLPVALSTLATAALFGPVSQRVRGLVDRRFYRSRYDAQRTLDAFTARLRDEVDLPAVGGSLLHVAGQAVQPHGATLWLRSRPTR